MRIAFDNLDMHSCCYCVADESGSNTGLDPTDVSALAGEAQGSQEFHEPWTEGLDGKTDEPNACPEGQTRNVCPVNVLSCSVIHSKLETCLTYFNDYIMFADFVLHFFVGFKQMDIVTRMEVTIWDQTAIKNNFVSGAHGSQFWLMMFGALPIDTFFRIRCGPINASSSDTSRLILAATPFRHIDMFRLLRLS